MQGNAAPPLFDVKSEPGSFSPFLTKQDEDILNEVDERMANVADVGRKNWKRPEVPALDPATSSVGTRLAPLPCPVGCPALPLSTP